MQDAPHRPNQSAANPHNPRADCDLGSDYIYMADLSTQIETAATGPKRVVVDGEEVTARPISEMIAADEFINRKAAGNKSKLPIRLVKIKPDGAT